ncbi:peptide deformylase [Denitrovibrio acetiphilus DSM 12809]|uniref:Peptide deformylase n=1 Tax=Denitrovibrio acetiphilus (strain DSM 12809 / NBRC 114555 / N2460) TaxID=522772 RepID=D4H187_DENA2|nr:peptide deformylase [Denitrovibrio acetiphilus]ADD66835.1 peptide deformylase [Denitrovibrio acetiphilus DSM 12809]
MILEVKTFPDKVLRIKAEPVDSIDESITELLDNMVETMHARSGVGLAAPQVGISKRLIVIDTSAGENEGMLLRVINPEIISAEGEQVGEEGCLSIPGEYEPVRRAEKVTVKAMDENGKPYTMEAEGFLARAFQHEIDHLDGVLFIDRLPSYKKDTLKKTIKRRIADGDYVVTGTK